MTARSTLLLLCLLAATAAGALPDPALEDCLRARLREPGSERTHHALMLATEYRHLLAHPPTSVESEVARLLAECRDPGKARPLPLVLVPPGQVPDLADGADLQRLLESARGGLRRLSGAKTAMVPFGLSRVSKADAVASVQAFVKLLEANPTAADFGRSIREHFDVYRSPGLLGSGKVLFTAYVTPVYDGALTRQGDFVHPLYRDPGPGRRHVTRAQVYAGALAGKGLELCWLKDRRDAFQLEVQGSGFVKLAEGGYLHLAYHAKNGYSFRGVGRAMVKDGLLEPWEVDNLAERRYFREHPEKEQAYLELNQSVVYFKPTKLEKLPAPPGLVPMRSVAADPGTFARGLVAFADTREPAFDASDELAGVRPWRRWICFQDVGGAIKGPGRIDIYRGIDPDPRVGETMREPGALYIPLLKGTRLSR